MRAPVLLFAAALAAALPSLAAAAPLTAGFYLPWDKDSAASLAAHAGALDVVSPMSGSVDSAKGHVRWQPDPALAAAGPKTHAKVFPIISNAHDEVWDVAAAEAVMSDPAAGQAVIAELAAKARSQNYGGYVLDFENLTPKGLAAYPPFLARLRAALKPAGKEVWVTSTMGAEPVFVRALGQSTDAVVLMAYDQCWATSTPGPIAGLDWLGAAMDARLADLTPAHTVVALAAYGYDWPKGGRAEVIGAGQAEALAKAKGAKVLRNAPDGNPHFSYAAADGKPHEVWFLDAGAFRAQAAKAAARKVRGVAIWRLGLEDPALWSGPGARPGPTPAMGQVSAPAACAPLPH